MKAQSNSQSARRHLSVLAWAFFACALFNVYLATSSVYNGNIKGFAVAISGSLICGMLTYGMWRRISMTKK